MGTIIEQLNAAGVRYLLIGGQAMRMKGMPRFSMDWDFWIPNDRENLDKLNQALGDYLDCPVVSLGPQGQNFVQTYQTPWGIVQFHLLIPGVAAFDEAERRGQVVVDDAGTHVNVIDAKDLLAAKQASDRPQDQLDIDFLQQLIGESET